jgi:hypothetical protein
VLYMGDDVTDERAFAVLDDDAGDVTVKVGDGRPRRGTASPPPRPSPACSGPCSPNSPRRPGPPRPLLRDGGIRVRCDGDPSITQKGRGRCVELGDPAVQEGAFGGVAGEARRLEVGGPRLRAAPEPAQQVGPGGGQVGVAAQPGSPSSSRTAARAASGPSVIARATARFSATTGEGHATSRTS